MRRFMENLGERASLLVNNYLPDAFLIAILLGAVVYVLGLIFTPNGPLAMVKHAGGFYWKLLTFMMQGSIILIAGKASTASGPPYLIAKK